MKFKVESAVKTSRYNLRIGELSEISRIPSSVFLTPLLLLYSKSGSVTHMTREVLEMVTNISNKAVQIPLANCAQCFNGVKHCHQGISKFAGLPECLSYCTVQDPAEVTKVGYNDRNSISIWTHTGRKQLNSEKYMDMVEAFRPDIYHVLCDGDTNIESTQKRVQKAVDVTTSMFLACADRHAKSQILAQSSMLAVLEGGYNLKVRKESAQMFARHPLVEGFVIDGLHSNGSPVEDIPYQTIQPVITETLKQLPDDKLRVVHGGWRPDVVLQLVQAGVDVFDSSLVHLATERGCAFTFKYRSLSPSDDNGKLEVNGDLNGSHYNGQDIPDESKCKETTVKKFCDTSYQINLNDKMYFDDLSAVLASCTCLTCTKHSRAYIHHLLNTKEMLASVLLTIHNLHHYQKFFNDIREHGKRGLLLTIDPSLS